MQEASEFVRSLARDENGASASEYAVLVAIIIIAIAAAVSLFDLGNIFVVVANKVQSCVTSNGTC